MSSADESWPMIEEAVLHLFDHLNAAAHVAVGPRLDQLGWDEIESEYGLAATELLFRAQGAALSQTDSLDRVMLADLAPILADSADAVVLPLPHESTPASTGGRIAGVVVGPLRGRLAVPVADDTGGVSVAVVEAAGVTGRRMDTFDESVHWTAVSGTLGEPLVPASTQWSRALAGAQRALATELVSITDKVLRVAVDHVQVRVQYGTPIGSFQSPRHRLAEAWAVLDGARALAAEAWRSADPLLAQTAKAAAGRAHRTAADAALQVCGAIGLTAEHDLNRYVKRGFQLDALCGSFTSLENQLAEQLFDADLGDGGVPMLFSAASSGSAGA